MLFNQITTEVLTKVYNEIKANTLTQAEYNYIINYMTQFRSKEHVDNYIQRIKDGSESLDDFLGKMQHFR